MAVVYEFDHINESGTVTLYIEDQSFTAPLTSLDDIPAESLLVGGSSSPTGRTYAYNGLIDNVFVFADALTSAQIDDIRNNGTTAIHALGTSLPRTYSQPELLPARLPMLIGVSGDIAIMGQKWIPYDLLQPAKLVLVDAANPANIKRVGEYTFYFPYGNPYGSTAFYPEMRVDLFSAVSAGDLIYISDDSYREGADSLGSNPRLGDDPHQSNYRYYDEDYTSLLTFDISDPAQPVLVDRYDHPQPSRFRWLTLHGGRIYATDYNHGIRVFSLADPLKPTLVGGTPTAAEGHYGWVADDGQTAYSAQTFGGTIYAFDIENPEEPVKQGYYWDGEWGKSLYTGRGDYLYVPTIGGLNIVDVSDPAAMVRAGRFSDAYWEPVVHVSGDYAYTVASNHWNAEGGLGRFLQSYDISDPGSPVLQGEFDLLQRHYGVYAQGDYVYVIAPELLTIIDVQNPAQPVLAGQLADARLTMTGVEGGRMWVSNGYAYILTGYRNDQYFHIVDVFDPVNPVYVDTITGPNRHLTGIIIDGNYLFLGSYWGTFLVYDITNPVAPVEVMNAGVDLDLGGWEAAWSLGGLAGEYMAVSAISRFHLVDVPRAGQGLIGPVTAAANLNRPPVADAGGPYAVDEGASITLDGSGSFDPDAGDTLTYEWDLDYDGVSFDTDSTAPAPQFDASTLDGPASRTVALRVSDNLGAVSDTDAATIDVNNVAPTIHSITGPVDPVNINDQSMDTGNVTFSDPAGVNDELYTCDFDLDYDGVTFEPDATVNGVTGTSCNTPINYGEPGVYTVQVAVTDKDGGEGSATATDYIVIFNPEGGFVTGGGWIWSQAGWCHLDDLCAGAEGKANFGFVSKYRKGASVPTGNTEFNFKAGGLNFHSDAYEWLVVNQDGTNAQYKGSGTINGDVAPNGEPYRFMLWAKDLDPDDDDTFRIKIWYEGANGEIAIYDNGFDQAIGGGNIVVHTK